MPNSHGRSHWLIARPMGLIVILGRSSGSRTLASTSIIWDRASARAAQQFETAWVVDDFLRWSLSSWGFRWGLEDFAEEINRRDRVPYMLVYPISLRHSQEEKIISLWICPLCGKQCKYKALWFHKLWGLYPNNCAAWPWQGRGLRWSWKI